MPKIELIHGRITLALHELRADGDGKPLLALHGLGLRSPDQLPEDLEPWSGPVYALDFTGHGESTVPNGGGYTPETLIGDVDAALSHLGETTLVGRGLGAYVALLTSGARADVVRGTILCDGPGIAGGGPQPGTPTVQRIDLDAPVPPDPFAMTELSRDIRPSDYAIEFVRLAFEKSPLPNPISVCAKARPEWLEAVAEEVSASPISLADALRMYSR